MPKENKIEREAYDYHLPVLLEESIENLITKPDGIYIDGTLGGGGHAAAILHRLISGGKLLAFDMDFNAIEYCKRKFQKETFSTSGALVFYNQNFSESVHAAYQWGLIQGLLLDLGVSSRQLDTDQIGLSYRINSRLDMRFSGEGQSAEDLINNAHEEKILKILRDYGEEPAARKITSEILKIRKLNPIKTTFDLRDVVARCVPQKIFVKTLSRVFQALRIAVNKELDILEETLTNILPKMAVGGRYVIISYHSLEDRIVKNFFKEHQMPKVNKYAKEEPEINSPKLKILTKKPIEAGAEEISKNPRARSAKMRIAERVL